MQYEKFKKRVLIESGVIAAVMAVAGGIIFLLGSINDDYVESNDAAKKAVDVIDLESHALKAKYDNIVKNIAIYKEVQKKQADNQLSINRQIALEKFNQFKNTYQLNNLRLSVSPVEEIKDAQFKRKGNQVSYSEVDIGLEVLSDETVYNLLSAVEQEFSGVIKISKLTLTRIKPVDQEVLTTIAQQGTYSLIKAEVKLLWFGVSPVAAAAPVADTLTKPPN